MPRVIQINDRIAIVVNKIVMAYHVKRTDTTIYSNHIKLHFAGGDSFEIIASQISHEKDEPLLDRDPEAKDYNNERIERLYKQILVFMAAPDSNDLFDWNKYISPFVSKATKDRLEAEARAEKNSQEKVVVKELTPTEQQAQDFKKLLNTLPV